MLAYDLAILPHRAERATPDCHGWCFGLPPGIASEQWPLDPANGYPLQHGFTLLLPEDYRCHGPEIVAVAFFASALDHNDGGPDVEAPEIAAAMLSPDRPNDPDLVLFWQAERKSHPCLHRFEDILGSAFAAILLTEPEFDGPLCRPPDLTPNRYRDRLPAPAWMAVGSGAAYWVGTYSPHLGLAEEQYGVYRTLDGEPDENPGWNRALRWTPLACDPNGGRVPWDPHLHEPTDYVQPFTFVADENGEEQYQEEAWAADLVPNHIGGTMQPSQWVPRFSPYYIEFGENLGGYNFGGGNAQLDIRDMKFEWACG